MSEMATGMPQTGVGDMSDELLDTQLHIVAAWIARYRANVKNRPISTQVEPGSIEKALDEGDWERGASFEQIMTQLDEIVMPGVVHWGHPSFLGYFGSTSNGPALLGEMISAALNVSAMTWKTSPSATEMETVIVRRIASMIGLDPSFRGIVYDTASVSTMHALAAARESLGLDVRHAGLSSRDVPRLRIYASDQAHSSVEKSAILLGVGEENVVRIPSNDNFALDLSALTKAIDTDIANGFKPMAVVATIGTTSTASVDPVSAIADICAQREIWLHVDAAYGAALAILPEGRWVMEGTDRVDSIVVNPHKWMFVPLDFSVLFVKKPHILKDVFALTPEYLRGDSATQGTIDYMDFGIQLGRRFRALKAWMTFRWFGREGIESRIREHCRLAAEFAKLVQAEDRFVLTAPVVMSVVCFRFEATGQVEIDDRINESIVETVNASGRAFLTHTRLKGRTAMRIGIGNIATEWSHVLDVWNEILDAARNSH
jgi:aromatic-L-amino-acid decarboxylase